MCEEEVLNQTCPFCGARLHENASFCPCCASSINPRTECKPPRPLFGKALRVGIVLLVLIGIVFGGSLYGRPRTFDGAGEVIYSDEDGKYQLLLSYVDSRYYPLPEREDAAELDVNYTVPSCLFVNLKDSGADATQGFLQKVEHVTAAFIQPSDSPSPMTCSDPAHADSVPEAALVSYVHFTGRSGTAQLVWTIEMKNGDVIRLRQTYNTKPIRTYNYYPEDMAMNTMEELQALIGELEQTVEKQDVVNIYLPPVTYEGSLALEERSFNFYGSTEDGKRTTFTDTIRITAKNAWIFYFNDIDFVGSGDGVGISCSSRAHLINCTVTGWKTGVLAYGYAWVNVTECRVENNGVGFHYNSNGDSVSHSLYLDNEFTDNGTAVLLENVPTDVTLDFGGCLFSGNGKDIDNLCNQPIKISEAIFQ